MNPIFTAHIGDTQNFFGIPFNSIKYFTCVDGKITIAYAFTETSNLHFDLSAADSDRFIGWYGHVQYFEQLKYEHKYCERNHAVAMRVCLDAISMLGSRHYAAISSSRSGKGLPSQNP